MSPGLLAQVTAADAQDAAAVERAERAHRARWQAAQERAEDEATWQLARETGVPLAQARREIGHEPREFIELCAARADLEDARQQAAQAQAMRRHLIAEGLLDVSADQPSERSIELAAHTMLPGETAVGVGRQLRSRFLKRNYRRME
jgi:hypothetical protein